MESPAIKFDASPPPFLLAIRTRLFALVAFLVLILVFSGFYLQSVLNENALMTARQSDIIQALTGTSDANVQFSAFRWSYLTFLNQPNSRTAKPVYDNIRIFREQLSNLKKLPLGSDFNELNQNIDSLQEVADSLIGSNISAQKTERMTQDAMTALGRIDDVLGSMGESLKTLLNEKSEETLQRTSGMRGIPASFILGGLLSVVVALSVIIIDILVPINKITRAMAAASADMENARDHMLPVDRNDEVGKITRTLNHLLEEVSSGIDKIRQTENMLNHAQRMEMMGRMSGGIAHDFNNMLIVISGNLELIERRIGNNPELKEMVDSALASVEKGKNLTQRILVFSRKQILKPKTMNINKQIPDIVELVRRVVREDMIIETDLASDLWNIHADPGHLENALLNLAINARDAIPGNDGKIIFRTQNVTVDNRNKSSYPSIEPGTYAMISITDNGIGIPADIIDRIFDPFFTTKEPGKGTGLGLSMVYGFTRQSGGHVSIDSQPNNGTTINLFFPKAEQTTQDDLQGHTTRDLSSETVKGGHESLLVVEDREDILKYLSTTLRQLGYRVTTAKNGPSALKHLQKRKNLDMLITDVVMPGHMNGEELATEVGKKFPKTKVLYISGYTHNALINQGSIKPGVNLLVKPFTRADLAHEIRHIFDNSR